MRLHRLSMLHAERIISDLLESVIDSMREPLVVNKLQGDSVLLYAHSDGSPERARGILQQVVGSFAAFRKRERELVSRCGICACDACWRVQDLRLKAVVHHGPVIFKRVGQFDEIAGEDVILAHRLLKNTIGTNEYILLSEAFEGLAGGPSEHRREPRKEACEGFGRVGVVAYFPLAPGDQQPLPKSIAKRLAMAARLDAFLIKRLFTRNPRKFHNLSAAQDEPPQGTS
jgi:hypothetical protein